MQGFADQFEADGADYIYRESGTGPAYRVSSEARDRFIEKFERENTKAQWMAGIAAIGLVVVYSIVIVSLDADFSSTSIYLFIAFFTAIYYLKIKRLWSAPSRDLVGHLPISPAIPKDQARRRALAKINYRQLLIGPVFGSWLIYKAIALDELSTVDRVAQSLLGAGLIVLSAVQAYRKWQAGPALESDDDLRVPKKTGAAIELQEAPPSPAANYKAYAILAITLGGVGLLLTPLGKKFLNEPDLIFMLFIALAAWAISTVVVGLARGRITPFVRGFASSYERETQPKRFWASIAWNAAFGMLILVMVIAWWPDKANKDEARCYDRKDVESSQEVISACEALMAANPKDSDPVLYRGLMLLDMNKFDAARDDFTRAHTLNPKSAWPLANRGIANILAQDSESAKRDLDEARKIDPDNPVMLRGEAQLELEAGRHENAIAILDRQLKREPDDIWALRFRADAYQQMGEFEKAKADRERAERIFADNARD